MVRTQIYLTQAQKDYFQRQACKNGTTLAAEIRAALDELRANNLLEAKKAKQAPRKKNALQEMAEHAEKLDLKGPNDLASNLDDYLYGNKSELTSGRQ